MFIFHKTEIQTVILRCLTSLNYNWYKSYAKRYKNAKNTKEANVSICTKSHTKKEMEIFAFCVITYELIISKSCQAPQNDRLDLSFVKDEHTYGKKMARKGRTKVIYKGTFISKQSLLQT
jgi:hypothetical protein